MRVRCLRRRDSTYPRALRELGDAPEEIHLLGSLEPEPRVAIVGSRACSRYGREVATELARDLASRGASIVSGLARGIDAAAHEGALAAPGHTVAVLPAGLQPVYPRRHRALAERIAQTGALVTELEDGTQVAPWHFPRRNRIIAGLSRVVIVVEAAARSGARITADLALGYGRDVLVVPGPITSRTSVGCHQLIGEGAFPCTGIDDVLEHLDLPGRGQGSTEPRPAPEPPNLSASERTLLSELRPADPVPLDELGAKLDLPIDVLLVAATGLELRGLAVLLPGNRIEAR